MKDEAQTQDRKVAVITGASSGIGYATAMAFAKKGYHIVLAARRQKELKTLAEKCQEYDGVKALSVVTDMSDDTAAHALALAAVREFGKIDVWVNNASVYMVGKFQDTPIKDMRRLMDVNFFGYVHGSHAALEQFRKQNYGTMISIASVNAAAPQPYVSAYSASKAAVWAFNEALRMELEIDGLSDRIHVCTVLPAVIDTNLFQNSANYSGKEVQAMRPVYDPGYVAKRLVKLAEKPKREIIVGPAGKMLILENMVMPSEYERRFSQFTDKDLFTGAEAGQTKGNLYDPIPTNTGSHGGWREHRLRADHLNAALGMGLAAVAGIGLLGYSLFKRQTN